MLGPERLRCSGVVTQAPQSRRLVAMTIGLLLVLVHASAEAVEQAPDVLGGPGQCVRVRRTGIGQAVQMGLSRGGLKAEGLAHPIEAGLARTRLGEPYAKVLERDHVRLVEPIVEERADRPGHTESVWSTSHRPASEPGPVLRQDLGVAVAAQDLHVLQVYLRRTDPAGDHLAGVLE